MPSFGDETLYPSSGQMDSTVLALLDSIFDKNESVCRSISNSLYTIGKSQPELVLSRCHLYITKHKKLPISHRILILNVMERVCSDSADKLSDDLVHDIIKLSIEEMVNTKEVVVEWQTAASSILVSIGHKYLDTVMEYLLLKFQPGVIPHFYVVQTLANLSTSNVFFMVPYLKAILGTTLPMLGMIKQENTKLVFAYALARFAEAIMEYLANLEKAPDPSVKKEVFSAEIGSAYDILFNNWLQSREAKVRAEVVQALGHMTPLLGVEKMDEMLAKVIPGILALYKKQQEALPVTEGLCMVLDAAAKLQSASLETQIENILAILFPQVCGLPDYSQPSSVKNHNEVLRCFTVLVSHPSSTFCDRLVTFLLQRLENNNERTRIGALSILKHLINSSESQITSKISTIVSSLKIIINDPNNKVKKVLAQVIVALAHHGHLEMEGSQPIVSFIIQQCALPEELLVKRPPDADYVSNEALRSMCENVLHLLTTTVDKMERVLWPYLFECLLPEELTAAVGPVCKSIAYLATKKREEQSADFDIDFANLPNIPKPPAIAARLFVLLGHPFQGRNRGISILRCLRAITPLMDRSLMALWDTNIPQMLLRLEAADDLSSLPQKEWNQSLSSLVSKSLEEIDREDWTIKFGKALLSQLPLYHSNSEDKCILLSILGTVLKRASNKQFVNSALDIIFDGVQHTNPLEREGCAVAAGYCGSSHLDAVLVKLENVVKEEQKKNSGILSFIMDLRGEAEQDKVKATVILTYGHLAMNAPTPILTTRIETPILRSMANFYQSSRELSVKQAMLQSVRLIAESLHPDHLKQAFNFNSRNDLLSQMQSILKSESGTPLTTNIRALTLMAAASLAALEPDLGSNEKLALIQNAASAIYPVPLEHLPNLNRAKEEIEEVEDYGQLLASTLEALNCFLKQLLLKEKTPENLAFMLKAQKPWLSSRMDHEREQCIESISILLKLFLTSQDPGNFTVFTTVGSIFGLLVPRCTDPKISVRLVALRCIAVVISICNQTRISEMDDSLTALKDLEKLSSNDDASSLFTVTNELAKIIAKTISSDQLAPLVESLIESLSDLHPNSSSGASVVLNGVIKARGNELRTEVPHIVDLIEHQLESMTCHQTRIGTLCVLRSLAQHHLAPVVNTLMHAPLPFSKQVIDSWKEIARESGLGKNIMDHLLDTLTDEQLVENLQDARNSKHTISVASLHTLSAVSALREIFLVIEMEQYAKENFNKIFSTLLLVTATYVGAYQPANASEASSRRKESAVVAAGSGSVAPSRPNTADKASKLMPVRCAIEAFKSFLLCTRQDVILTELTDHGHWITMEDEDKYPEALAALARSVCNHWPHQIPKIIANLNGALSSPYEAQRIATISVFAELLAQSFEGNQTLSEPLINSLLGHLVDSSKSVRRLCIKGLGCMGNVDKEQVHRYSTTVLSAMMAGMDDKDDPENDITLEAMSGLSSVLAQVDEEDVRDILVNITLRIRPMFDKDKAAVRAAAFTLFGNLSRFGMGPSREAFVEQVHSNLVALLLHLNDDNLAVVKTCKQTLRGLGPVLGETSTSEMFRKHLLEKAQLHYGEFIKDLTKAIISDFPDRLPCYINNAIPYLKNSRSVIQCNAAVLLGYLLGNLSSEKQIAIHKDKVCSTLIVMLKDTNPDVRMKAAEALGLLHSF